jgi:chemotaxis protein MotB
MGKKCKCPPAGAPEWVLTYGDMMSLLLTFFILLVALSEIRKPEQLKSIADEIRKAFGMSKGGGDSYQVSLFSVLETLEQQTEQRHELANADDPGIEGRDLEVTRIREGMLFTQGGLITFEPGSADLSDTAKRNLKVIADLVRGYTNKIEVRGHAATMELGPGSRFADLWTLSFTRAKAVMDYLTSAELGVRPERVRLVANADYEPLASRVYTPATQEPNRRVEILVMEALVEDFSQSQKGGPK